MKKRIRGENGLSKLLKNVNAYDLIHDSSPGEVLDDFKDLKDGEKYHMYK